MAEYEVSQISGNPPKEYDGAHGKIYYIKTMLKGHPKPVSIGKKTPNALKPGDTVYGTIVPTEYDTDNFKSENKPYQAAQGGQPKDHDVIKAQMAVKAAVHLYSGKGDEVSDDTIEKRATSIYAMVDRVKGSSVDLNTIAPNTQIAPKQQASTFSDGSPVPDFVEDVDIDSPIDLSDIPF